MVEANVEGNETQIARGQTIALWSCAGCHSLDKELPLSGGENTLADVPMPLGQATPPNLTPGGRIDEWTDGQLQRAIREGTSPSGHLMPLMAINTFRYLSQPDLDAIVAYLRSQPTVESEANQENPFLSSLRGC
ncbi:MAG TPA: cytochrome c [Dehalococcoidia bacterium]|nr:cytochrome c [Dehalococcoidia bacterium]